MCYNNMDNGFTKFNHIRIPRQNEAGRLTSKMHSHFRQMEMKNSS